jgi:hypothetical protein
MKDFKKPDLNAPRCRESIHQILSNDFVKKFIEKYPQYAHLTLKDVRLILNTFHGKLWNHVVHNREGIELPEGLGYIFLGTCFSAKKYNTDFGNSIKSENLLRHRNFESDNFLAKIFYTNYANKYKFRNRELWVFKAHRDFKRAVAPSYKENWKIFLQVENGKHITKYLKTVFKNDWVKKVQSNFVVDPLYNEFDLT